MKDLMDTFDDMKDKAVDKAKEVSEDVTSKAGDVIQDGIEKVKDTFNKK